MNQFKMRSLSLLLVVCLALLCSIHCLAEGMQPDPDGTTVAVDNTTELTDGSYIPAQFSFSGGTGKVKITCPEIVVTDGKAYANLVFSSSSYSYVKASGIICYAEIVDGKSTFTIPIALEANNPIFGLTTKMSTPHEVEYQLFVSMTEASVSSDALDQDAPEIAGLTFVEEIPMEHAKLLKLFQYADGIVLAEIDTMRETQEAEADSAWAVYGRRILKYLLVPEGVDFPAGLEKECVVISLPVSGVYTATDFVWNKLVESGWESTVCAVGMEDAVSDTAPYGGSIDSPSYRTLVLQKAKLALADESMLTYLDETMADRFQGFGIAALPDCSALEDTQDGQAEWGKLYDILFSNAEGADEA